MPCCGSASLWCGSGFCFSLRYLRIRTGSYLSLWCGTGSCLSIWCGSGSYRNTSPYLGSLMLKNDPLRLPPFHFNADPDPTFCFDADPDPAFHFDADPDPASQNDADPDPASENDADPGPQHSYSLLFKCNEVPTYLTLNWIFSLSVAGWRCQPPWDCGTWYDRLGRLAPLPRSGRSSIRSVALRQHRRLVSFLIHFATLIGFKQRQSAVDIINHFNFKALIFWEKVKWRVH